MICEIITHFLSIMYLKMNITITYILETLKTLPEIVTGGAIATIAGIFTAKLSEKSARRLQIEKDLTAKINLLETIEKELKLIKKNINQNIINIRTFSSSTFTINTVQVTNLKHLIHAYPYIAGTLYQLGVESAPTVHQAYIVLYSDQTKVIAATQQHSVKLIGENIIFSNIIPNTREEIVNIYNEALYITEKAIKEIEIELDRLNK